MGGSQTEASEQYQMDRPNQCDLPTLLTVYLEFSCPALYVRNAQLTVVQRDIPVHEDNTSLASHILPSWPFNILMSKSADIQHTLSRVAPAHSLDAFQHNRRILYIT
jgi:hypothetical protein